MINPNEQESGQKTLTHYQLRGRLGEGGFGEVFEAWDQKLHRRVAIKRLKSLSGTSRAESLIREARLAASLQHAAFVKVHALEEDGDSQSIIMELVPGMTLRELIRTQPPDEAKALDIVRQIARAMQEAHDSGLIHGDLKPSNLMLEPSGKVRILDFGLATCGDPDATSSLSGTDPQGTIAYLAPERLLGNAPSPQSDIYALGTILYELAGGVRPFAALSGLALAAAHMQSSSAQWPYPQTMRPGVVRLIRAMTARELEDRMTDMRSVLERLVEFEEGSVVSAAPAQAQTQTMVPAKSVLTSVQKSAWNKLHHNVQRGIFFSAAMVLIVFAGWKAAPHIDFSWESFRPYSESVTMKQGLDALKLFDRRGSLDIATRSFETVLKHDVKNAAAVAGMSLVYSFRYASDVQDEIWRQKADAAAQHAMSLNDQLSLAYVAKAFVLAIHGKREEALEHHEKALALDPMNIFAYFGKFQSLLVLRRFDQAREVALTGSQRFPQERVFLDGLGTVFYQQGDYKNAELAFRQSIQLQPDAVLAYSNLSNVLSRLGRHEEALQILQQGLQIRPNATLYTTLGVTLFQRGDYVAAASAFEKAVSPDKGNPARYSHWSNLADTLLWIPGRKQEARGAYQKAIELLQPALARSPNDVTLLSRMALYAARTGDSTQATSFAAKVVLLAPDSPDVQFRVGLAHELLGNRKSALEAIAKAKSLGYSVKTIEAEPDLVALRRDPSYQP